MPRPFRSLGTYVALLVGLVGVALVLYAFRLPPFATSVERTNDAYVRGQVTVIAPQVAGIVVEVAVQDYESVEAGRLIARIDDRTPTQRLAQARATLAGQRAALANSQQQRQAGLARVSAGEAAVSSARSAAETAAANLARVQPLAREGYVPGSELDVATRQNTQAAAALQQAEAQLEVTRQDLQTVIVNRQSLEAAVDNAVAAVRLAEIDLANTRILAPRAGRLGEVGVRVGQYAQAGTQLTSLVPDALWVVANFKETQLPGMRAGQPVRFTVDAFAGLEMHGHIERFAPATGSEFAVLRPDNATGNFTKVAQRVPVRIRIDPGQPRMADLAPGLSVVVSVDTASRPEEPPAAPAAAPAATGTGGNGAAPAAPAPAAASEADAAPEADADVDAGVGAGTTGG